MKKKLNKPIDKHTTNMNRAEGRVNLCFSWNDPKLGHYADKKGQNNLSEDFSSNRNKKRQRKKYEVKESKITKCRSTSNTKNNTEQKCGQQKKQFRDMTTKPTTDEQTNNWPTILFETEYFPFGKKTGPGQKTGPGKKTGPAQVPVPLPSQAYSLPPG